MAELLIEPGYFLLLLDYRCPLRVLSATVPIFTGNVTSPDVLPSGNIC
jgi:hypothetical protein